MKAEGQTTIDYARLFDVAPTPYLVLDAEMVILAANAAYSALTGHPREELVGKQLLEALAAGRELPDDCLDALRASLERARDRGEPDAMAASTYRLPLREGGVAERHWSPVNVPVLDDDGETVLLLHRIVDLTDVVADEELDDQPTGRTTLRQRVAQVEAALVARVKELERLNRELREARDQLARQSVHDPLTGLLMRATFLEQLGHALARLARHDHSVAVLFIDLDRLKPVNDQYGHAAGDELIRQCAQRLRASVRPSDAVGRIGGDEFVVLLDDLRSDAEADAVAERLLTDLSAPCRLGANLVVHPTASIGIAVSRSPKSNAETMVAHADAAMYRAKQSGRGRYERFDERAYRAVSERRQLQSQLRGALQHDEMELYYQPIIDLATGNVHGVEALLRWHHPLRGLLAANAFIDVAEETGLVVDLGRWAVRQACEQLTAWDSALGEAAPKRMFVNLSIRELAHQGLGGDLERTITETRCDPGRIVVEVTERGVVQDPWTTGVAIEMIQRLGCGLAIDDFGTGYSSLSRLVQLPADILKIDRTFVAGVAKDRESAAIVSAVLLLAQNLRKRVVAEGVEDPEALTALRELGCSYAQGFHLALPQSAGELTERLLHDGSYVPAL